MNIMSEQEVYFASCRRAVDILRSKKSHNGHIKSGKKFLPILFKMRFENVNTLMREVITASLDTDRKENSAELI